MKNTSILMIPVIALSLMGCTTTQSPQSDSSTEQSNSLKITKGKSKKQDVIKMYGEPQSKEVEKDGTEQWIYSGQVNNSTQIMWVCTPVPEGMKSSPNMEVTTETKVDGNKTLQKVIITPDNNAKATMSLVFTFSEDTVKEFTYKLCPNT